MGNLEAIRSSAGEDCRAWPREEVRNLVRFSSLLALGILLNTLESLILPRGWPVRLGLANLSLMCGLFLLRPRDLFLLAAFRVIISSLILGYFFQLPMWLGLAGGVAATTVMEAAYAVHRGVFPGLASAGWARRPMLPPNWAYLPGGSRLRYGVFTPGFWHCRFWADFSWDCS